MKDSINYDINTNIRNRVNSHEIYRYLGYGTVTPDDDVQALVESVLTGLTETIKPANIYKVYNCEVQGSEVNLFYNDKNVFFIKSRNLADNLAQCHKVILLAATLGLEADKLLHKYEILNMTKAAVVQACGAACIEAYCNILQEEICEEYTDNGKKLYLRPRFSAGYGDLPLEYQKSIFDELECTKRIGLTLTDSLLMYPTKSVTAFIGLTANPQSCHIDKCKQCDKIDCEFNVHKFADFGKNGGLK